MVLWMLSDSILLRTTPSSVPGKPILIAKMEDMIVEQNYPNDMIKAMSQRKVNYFLYSK
jgi:hypothetical protein